MHWLDLKSDLRILYMDLAVAIGDREALLLVQMHYWMLKMQGSPRHNIDGRIWFYKTIAQMREQDFPCWSERTIERLVSKLKEQGLIETGNFNKSRSDRTKWYTIWLDHPLWSTLMQVHTDKVAVSIPTNCGVQSDKVAGSNQKTTQENTNKITDISPSAKTVEQIAAEQGLGTPEDKAKGFDFEEIEVLDTLMEHRNHGTVISVWWRKCMRGYGHVDHTLPELTGKEQKHLQTLIKQMGPQGPLRIMMALKFWPEYKKYANAEFGLKSTVKPVIQKFVLGRNALAGFDPPKEVDYTEKEWKSL